MKNWIEQLERYSSQAAIFCVYLYQKIFSPDHGMFGELFGTARCRFYPSCSEYAKEAIRQHGLFLGIVASLKRIFRCNPLSQGGYDPVTK